MRLALVALGGPLDHHKRYLCESWITFGYSKCTGNSSAGCLRVASGHHRGVYIWQARGRWHVKSVWLGFKARLKDQNAPQRKKYGPVPNPSLRITGLRPRCGAQILDSGQIRGPRFASPRCVIQTHALILGRPAFHGPDFRWLA